MTILAGEASPSPASPLPAGLALSSHSHSSESEWGAAPHRALPRGKTPGSMKVAMLKLARTKRKRMPL